MWIIWWWLVEVVVAFWVLAVDLVVIVQARLSLLLVGSLTLLLLVQAGLAQPDLVLLPIQPDQMEQALYLAQLHQTVAVVEVLIYQLPAPL